MTAPRGASKIVTVKLVDSTEVVVVNIPNNQKLLSDFSVVYEEAKINGHISLEAPDVMFVR